MSPTKKRNVHSVLVRDQRKVGHKLKLKWRLKQTSTVGKPTQSTIIESNKGSSSINSGNYLIEQSPPSTMDPYYLESKQIMAIPLDDTKYVKRRTPSGLQA